MKQAEPPSGSQDPPTLAIPLRRDLKPVLPSQSSEDTDVEWGERPDLDDTERLIRERPPHWE